MCSGIAVTDGGSLVIITRAVQYRRQYSTAHVLRYIRGAKNKINVTLVLLVVAVHTHKHSVFAAADIHPGYLAPSCVDDTTAGTATSRGLGGDLMLHQKDLYHLSHPPGYPPLPPPTKPILPSFCNTTH